MARSSMLTYAFGTADEQDVTRQIAEAGGPAPFIVQADITRADDTAALVAAVHERFGTVHALHQQRVCGAGDQRRGRLLGARVP